MVLTGKQRHYLRGLAHPLSPVVRVGRQGISDALLAAIRQALSDHELIKIKLPEGTHAERREWSQQIATKVGADPVGQVGRVLLLYAPHPKRPVIRLPQGSEKTGREVRTLSTPE